MHITRDNKVPIIENLAELGQLTGELKMTGELGGKMAKPLNTTTSRVSKGNKHRMGSGSYQGQFPIVSNTEAGTPEVYNKQMMQL